MSFETSPANFLPAYERLDWKFIHYGDIYKSRMEESLHRTEDVVDTESEFSTLEDCQAYYNLANWISEEIFEDTSLNFVAVAYRTLQYGKEVVKLVYNGDVEVDLEKFSIYDDKSVPKEAIFGDADKLLLENNAIDLFVNDSQYHIDKEKRYRDRVEVILASILLFAEETRGEQFS